MAEHQFEGAIKGYLLNQIHAHLWKFKSIMTEEDAYVEGWLLFSKCADMYPDVDPPHFMALYKTTISRRMIDWAREATDSRALSLTSTETGEQLESVGDLENDGYFHILLQQAPQEVKSVLTLFINAPTELLQLAMDSWKSAGHVETGGNRQVAQWLGLPAGSRPLDAVRDYFEA